ncbi:MAG: hypothetical protein AAF488_17800 [Planctomycetota bacterium]
MRTSIFPIALTLSLGLIGANFGDPEVTTREQVESKILGKWESDLGAAIRWIQENRKEEKRAGAIKDAKKMAGWIPSMDFRADGTVMMGKDKAQYHIPTTSKGVSFLILESGDYEAMRLHFTKDSFSISGYVGDKQRPPVFYRRK